MELTTGQHVKVVVDRGMTRLRQDVLKLGSSSRRLHTAQGGEVEVSYEEAGYENERVQLGAHDVEHFRPKGAYILVAGIGQDSQTDMQMLHGIINKHLDGNALLFAKPKTFNEPRWQHAMASVQVAQRMVRDLLGWVVAEDPEKVTLPMLEESLKEWLPVWEEQGASSSVEAHAPYLALRQRLSDEATGRLDGSRIAKLLGLSTAEMGSLCGVSKQSFHANPTSKGIQAKLEPLVRAARGVLWCGGDEGKFRTWLNEPNADFPEVEGRQLSPLDLIRLGHAQVVADKVQNLLTGHPT